MNNLDFKQKLMDFLLPLGGQGYLYITEHGPKLNELNQKIDQFIKELDLEEEKDALTLQEKLQAIATLTTTLQIAHSTRPMSTGKESWYNGGEEISKAVVAKLNELIPQI